MWDPVDIKDSLHILIRLKAIWKMYLNRRFQGYNVFRMCIVNKYLSQEYVYSWKGGGGRGQVKSEFCSMGMLRNVSMVLWFNEV